MPPPCDGSQVSPSSSVRHISEVVPASCDSNVRPVCGSVNRIGSSDVCAVHLGRRALLFSQRAVAGALVSSNDTRYVSLYAWYITLPLFQFTPIDGSPA